MRHGAFSVSKTAGATVAMLYLAQRFGPQVFDELIKDHINVTADHDGWDQVTFAHTLSMVTGVGCSVLRFLFRCVTNSVMPCS